MLEMKCPQCGGTMQVEEGRFLRACPYCGAPLERGGEAPAWEIPGPSELETRLEKEQNPKKKYKLIQQALERDPDDFCANRALLYHGRLHEGLMRSRGGPDYSIIKCYLLNIFEAPEKYSESELDEKYEELLRGAQLKKVLSLCGDEELFMRDYLNHLCMQYVELFIRGETRNSTLAFGIRRTLDSTAKLCAVPVRKMLETLRVTPRLNGNENERAMLLGSIRASYEALFPGKQSYIA